jgi:hypothetical protein
VVIRSRSPTPRSSSRTIFGVGAKRTRFCDSEILSTPASGMLDTALRSCGTTAAISHGLQVGLIERRDEPARLGDLELRREDALGPDDPTDSRTRTTLAVR